jgi:hypothetical protein
MIEVTFVETVHILHAKYRSNSFSMDNQICQLGLVAPLHGFLEQNNPIEKGPNTAYMLRGCLKSSK